MSGLEPTRKPFACSIMLVARTHDKLKEYCAGLNANDQSFLVVEEYDTKAWQILRYEGLNNFVNNWTYDRSFYSLFYKKQRYMYIDIDHYMPNILDTKDIWQISQEALRILTNFMNLYNSKHTHKQIHQNINKGDFYVFCSSRSGSFFRHGILFPFKLSLHIYNPKIVYDHHDTMKKHMQELKAVISNLHANVYPHDEFLGDSVSIFDSVDTAVYSKIQYLRSFSCKYGDPSSIKKIIHPYKNIHLKEGISVMQADNIDISITKITISKKKIVPSIVRLIDSKVISSTFDAHRAVDCVGSFSSHKCLIKGYVFESIRNKLQWNETRTYQGGSLKSIEYECTTYDIKYPRLFATLAGLSCDELTILSIKIHLSSIIFINDTYNYLFTNAVMYDDKHERYYALYFAHNVKNLSHCGHALYCLYKNKLSCKNLRRRRAEYELYCERCNKFYAL